MKRAILIFAACVLFSVPSAAQQKNVSFACAAEGQVYPCMPDWVLNWIKKNQKHYLSVAFAQTPASNKQNYLIVFSTSESVFKGFEPVVHLQTSTSTSDTSGRGTATDNHGNRWDYTYNGTATTTTTTSTQESVPYKIESVTLYAHAYTQRGVLASLHSRSLSKKEGGDPTGTLEYNLGAALRRINLRGGLLNDTVKDVARSQ